MVVRSAASWTLQNPESTKTLAEDEMASKKKSAKKLKKVPLKQVKNLSVTRGWIELDKV